ncbi:MAG: hypothetical protein U0360_02815 [Dehalococcoidia bacterium]
MERTQSLLLVAHRRSLDVALAALAIALVTFGGVGWSSAPSRLRSETGTLVVADLRGHALTVIDLSSGERRTIPLEGGPHELLRLPDGRLAVSLEQAGRIALVEWRNGIVEYLETRGLPHGLALEGAALLVTDRAAGAVRRFEIGSWGELEPSAVDGVPHQVVARTGARFVANASSDRLSLGNGRSVPQPALTESIAASPDGTYVAVAGALDGRLLLYDRTRDVSREVELGGRPVRVVFSPSGRAVAVALSAAGEVTLVDIDGGVRRIEVDAPDGLAFSTDGRVLFVADIAGSAVTEVELPGGRVLARLDGGATAGALAFIE